MHFTEYLKGAAKQINSNLKSIFKVLKNEVKRIEPQLLPLAKTFATATDGGKRLRGVLVILGYEIAGGEKNSEILKISSAFEVFQTAILSHDDIIDQSSTRRGKQTIYKSLGGEQYGISQAICIGDLGFFTAYKLISESNFNAALKTKALCFFSKAMIKTVLGEALDVEISLKKKVKKEQDALTISRLKTAYYTITGPLSLGAILGGGDVKLVKHIEQFGESLGIAFQIQDDILGVFGDEQTLGKSVTSDIEEGKNTLLITYALKHANKAQKQLLKSYYGRGKVTQTQHDQIKKLFIETGALDYSTQSALKYIINAKNLIPKLTAVKKYQELLSEMADYLVERNK